MSTCRGRKGAVLACLAGLVLALTANVTSASPDGQIVIRGADSGSHLQLKMSGDNLLVEGYLSGGEQAGCHTTRFRLSAVCPTSGVGSIQVSMGPSSDKVEVLDKLPVPVTAYLGAGSDKFIGNGEVDYCYPEATRRNRCLGGGGDDICITGPRNSDCVGGPGDDYCKHATGSDGCWGGSGDDVCVMGPGKDGCHGDGGNDRLYEGSGQGKLYGGPGRDFCDGESGVGRSYTCESGPRK